VSVGPTVEDELKFGYGAEELDTALLETPELSGPTVEEPMVKAGTLPVPVGPTTDVEFRVGYGADEDSTEELTPPEAVDERCGAELLLKMSPETLELDGRFPVPIGVDEELDAV
jgi:hypothetical protein